MAEASKVRLEQGGAVNCVSWWMWLVDAMCLLSEGVLYHLLYVILYGDNYSTATRGTGGVRGTCTDKISLQISAYQRLYFSLGPV